MWHSFRKLPKMRLFAMVRQLEDSRSVVSLHAHKHGIKARCQKGSYEKHPECAKGDCSEERRKAQNHNHLVNQFRLAHGLCDFLPGVELRIKTIGSICWHFVFPAFYPERFVEFLLPGAELKPACVIIYPIMEYAVYDPSGQQAHKKMIGGRSKGDGQGEEQPRLRAPV